MELKDKRVVGCSASTIRKSTGTDNKGGPIVGVILEGTKVRLIKELVNGWSQIRVIKKDVKSSLIAKPSKDDTNATAHVDVFVLTKHLG